MTAVGQHMICLPFQRIDRVAHGKACAGGLEHAEVILAVTDAGDLGTIEMKVLGKGRERLALRCLGGKDFHIGRRVSGIQRGIIGEDLPQRSLAVRLKK